MKEEQSTMSDAAILNPEIAPAPTALTPWLLAKFPGLPLRMHAGAFTPELFSSPQQELAAATQATAIADLGYRTRIRITGEDRLRWLNGMVSNAIQSLPAEHGNYNFILNAQGRIQGDAYIYRAAGHLLLDTDRSQAARLLAHLDHFIIMDDVELHPLDDATTGIACIGPHAAETLDALGCNASSLAMLQFAEATLSGIPVTLVHAYSVLVPRFELWFGPPDAPKLWTALAQTGAASLGIDTVETLRVLEGIPRYGVDIADRHLPQETSQSRALSFTKGCYLGQEIVERIRSRATVHRSLRQFALTGTLPSAPAEIFAAPDPPAAATNSAAIGQLTSIAQIHLPGRNTTLALGFVRSEVIERKSSIEYSGGTVTALDHPPPLS